MFVKMTVHTADNTYVTTSERGEFPYIYKHLGLTMEEGGGPMKNNAP
jgi:hypothetical protein